MDVVSFRDWAGLPAHVMDLMVIKLDKLYDYVRFCGVCPLWRDVALEANVEHKVTLYVLKASRRKLPMLLFKTEEEESDECRSLYDVSGGKTFTVKLPLPYRYRFVGSSRGWLFCLAQTMAVTLVNLYNNACISLPAIQDPCTVFLSWRRRLFQFYIQKGILLSDPCLSPNSFVVVVIYEYCGKLAFFSSNEASWNFLNEADKLAIQDIICYKGKLYAVAHDGHFVEVDLESRSIKTISPGNDCRTNATYLVESQDGELLMVKRVWLPRDVSVIDGDYDNGELSDNNDDDLTDSDAESVGSLEYVEVKRDLDEYLPRTFEFKVLKMTNPVDQGSATWVEINNIGEQALFLGDSESMSVSTTEFPGCLPNSIYYTTQHHLFEWPYVYKGPEEDSGIFNLEDGKFHKHHVLSPSDKYVQPPIWFLPNPQC